MTAIDVWGEGPWPGDVIRDPDGQPWLVQARARIQGEREVVMVQDGVVSRMPLDLVRETYTPDKPEPAP